MYSYEGLLKKLNEKHMTRSDLTSRLGISSRTVAKIAKGEKLSRRTLEKVSDYFVCEPDEIYRVVSDNPILQLCFLQVQIPEICRQKWRILHLRFGESCRLPGRIA